MGDLKQEAKGKKGDDKEIAKLKGHAEAVQGNWRQVSWIGGTAHVAEAPPRTRRRLTSDLVHCCAVKSARRREPWHGRARLRFCLAKCDWGSQSFQSNLT